MNPREQNETDIVQPRGVEEPPFTMTAAAVRGARAKLARAPEPETVLGLRVGVAGGGCSGFRYVFDFARKVREGRDLVLDFDGLTVVVDRRSAEVLRGAVLDWEQGLLRHGFVWRNPNAAASCGCGTSFELNRSTEG